MKLKHVTLMLIFLCLFISVASASAIDDATMKNVSMTNEEINLEVSNGIETIEDLDSEIQNAAPNSTIKLENDILVNEDTPCKGIEISERITIDGQGHKIYGNSSGVPFFLRIHSENVILKNIIFTNWEMNHSYNLIEWIGHNGELRNCTFINNTANYGGAVDWTGVNGFLIDCTFINNAAENGGALFWYGFEGTIGNCTFINNTALTGGAAYITGRNVKLDSSKFVSNTAEMGGAVYADGINFILSNDNFVNNSASNGGAVYTPSYPFEVESCNFTDNTADETAGALYLASDNNTVKDCIFTNNTANKAGAIYSDVNDDLYVFNSKFNNNSANETGGAIMIEEYGNIVNSTFDNNRGGIGGAIYSDSEGDFINSTFTNNKADNGGAIAMLDGKIINSTFTKNFANETGGAITVAGDLTIDKITFIGNAAGNGSANIYSDDARITMIMNMTVSMSNITYGEILKVMVTLPDNITKGKIVVNINNKRYESNVTGNQTTVNIPNLNSDYYDVEVIYECDDYNSTTVYRNATVFQRDITLSAAKKSFTINYAGKYSVTVKGKNGKVISGEKVTIHINNKKIKTVTTNKNGVATVTITSGKLKSLKAGTKTLKVTLSNSNNPNSKSVKITINKEKTKIVAKKKTFKKSLKTKKYTITLKNSKNKAIKNVKVKLKVKGKTYTAKTNSKGKATFKITKLNKKGKYTAKIAFINTAYYKGVSKKVKLTIK